MKPAKTRIPYLGLATAGIFASLFLSPTTARGETAVCKSAREIARINYPFSHEYRESLEKEREKERRWHEAHLIEQILIKLKRRLNSTPEIDQLVRSKKTAAAMAIENIINSELARSNGFAIRECEDFWGKVVSNPPGDIPSARFLRNFRHLQIGPDGQTRMLRRPPEELIRTTVHPKYRDRGDYSENFETCPSLTSRSKSPVRAAKAFLAPGWHPTNPTIRVVAFDNRFGSGSHTTLDIRVHTFSALERVPTAWEIVSGMVGQTHLLTLKEYVDSKTQQLCNGLSQTSPTESEEHRVARLPAPAADSAGSGIGNRAHQRSERAL